jgi:hypothetical protein
MTGFLIFDLNSSTDVADWLAMWYSWPDREVFAHPEYIRLYAREQSQGLCAAWKSDGLCVLHPFLFRDVADEPFWAGPRGALFDVTSAYGYAGPFVWGEGDRDCVARKFWADFRRWALDHQVVSEFVRRSLFPGAMLPYPGETWTAATQIIRSLDAEEPALWMEFEHKVRKNVSKAMRSGVRIEIDPSGARLENFLGIYEETMDRRQALDCYYFGREYFEQMQKRLPGQFVYFHALLDGQVVSTELVLISERSVYSFLGGTRKEAFACCPNDLLKFEIIKWAKQHGGSHFVLGGGYRSEDGIYRYKRAFAPHGQTKYLQGGQIFLPDSYTALVGARQRFALEHGESWSPRQGFFPAYRS